MGALPRQGNERGQGARLREELIEAASDLLAERGDPDRLSIRAVAAAAGVTPASIYLHFVDRKSLLRAVVAERFRAFGRRLSDAEASGRDPFDALRRRCRAYFGFAKEHPGHYRVLFSAAALGPKGVATHGKTDHPGVQHRSSRLSTPYNVAWTQALVALQRETAPFWRSSCGHGCMDSPTCGSASPRWLGRRSTPCSTPRCPI